MRYVGQHTYIQPKPLNCTCNILSITSYFPDCGATVIVPTTSTSDAVSTVAVPMMVLTGLVVAASQLF